MKKLILVGVLVFTLAIGAFAVYADSPDDYSFGFGRGYGHHMGGYGHMRSDEYGKRIDLSDEEREEWLESRNEFFMNQSDLTEEEWEELFEERQEERQKYREERIKRALEEGIITEEEANEWREHFSEMDEFHEENGFVGRGCHGGRGRGYGRHMRGYGF